MKHLVKDKWWKITYLKPCYYPQDFYFIHLALNFVVDFQCPDHEPFDLQLTHRDFLAADLINLSPFAYVLLKVNNID